MAQSGPAARADECRFEGNNGHEAEEMSALRGRTDMTRT